MAFQVATKGLYKFRPYNDSWAEWVEAILLRGEVKFSRLEEFDDPFEGRPYAEAAYPDPEKQIHATRRAHVRAQILRGVSRKVAEKEVAALTIEDCRQNLVTIQEKLPPNLSHAYQLL